MVNYHISFVIADHDGRLQRRFYSLYLQDNLSEEAIEKELHDHFPSLEYIVSVEKYL